MKLSLVPKHNKSKYRMWVTGAFSFLHFKTVEEAAICWCCWINSWGKLTLKTFPHEGLFRIILSWMNWIHIVDSAACHLCSMTTSWDRVDPTWCRDNLVSMANYSVCWNSTCELPSVWYLQKTCSYFRLDRLCLMWRPRYAAYICIQSSWICVNKHPL